MNHINDHFTNIYYYLHPEQQASISHQSVRILQFIQKEQDVTVRKVADALQISHNTASEHIKKLELQGLVSKERSSVDQRIVNILLTDKGLKMVKENTELDNEKLKAVFSTLSTEQQKQIVEAFALLSEAAQNVYRH